MVYLSNVSVFKIRFIALVPFVVHVMLRRHVGFVVVAEASARERAPCRECAGRPLAGCNARSIIAGARGGPIDIGRAQADRRRISQDVQQASYRPTGARDHLLSSKSTTCNRCSPVSYLSYLLMLTYCCIYAYTQNKFTYYYWKNY